MNRISLSLSTILIPILAIVPAYAFLATDIHDCTGKNGENYQQACIRLLEVDSLPPKILSRANMGLGDYYYWQKNYGKALPYYHKAIILNPANKWAYISKGRSQAALGYYKKAIKTYNLGIEYSHIDNAQIYYNRGYSRSMTHDYKNAIDDYSLYLVTRPKDVLALHHRGYALHQTGALEEALQDYNDALTLAPGDGAIYLKRGDLFASFKQYEKALSDYDLSIQHQPNNAVAYYRRGTILRYTGKIDSSLRDCTKASSLDSYLLSAYTCIAKGKFMQLFQ